MFQNQNNAAMLGGAGGNPGAGGSAMDPTQQQQILNYNNVQHPHPHQQQQQQQPQQPPPQQQQQQQAPQPNSANVNNKSARKKPYVKITEQPASKALRFRYECEGRSAGSIPGVNSTPENKTYPTIEIVGYKGRAVVVVSCVTKDMPYRPHPHNLVGKEGCKKGVCTLEINSETMRAVFSNLGIQCVKKKDIESALKAREEIRVDPFKTGFSHRFQPSSIDLNSVRLCFQVFMEGERGRITQPLPPVVSDPIFDKKAMSDLVICRLCSCSASVLGGTQIILLCEKVAKEDIAVRFFEEKNGQVIWEAFGEFQHTDVHKQTAITFKTPKYHDTDIKEPAKVFIQLRRPSDGVTSEALPFEYVPMDSGRHTFWNLRRTLKRKPDEDIFQQILAEIGEKKPPVVIDLSTPTTESKGNDMFSSVVLTAPAEEVAEAEAEADLKRRKEQEIDTIIDEKVREMEQQNGQQQEQIEPVVQATMQQQTLPVDNNQYSESEKINEWMKSNEMLQMQTEPPTPQISAEEQVGLNAPLGVPSAPANDVEDKTLNDLLEQVAELDEIYADSMLRRDNYHTNILNELNNMDACVPDPAPVADVEHAAMDTDDNFDDTATYSSLQKAFKNPIDIPMDDIMPLTPPSSQMAPEDAQHYDPIELMADHQDAATKLFIDIANHEDQQSPPRPAPPKPFMHVTAAEEEKLPPLPPKRIRKQDSNAENRSIEANTGKSPIIIVKTHEESPLTKRLPPKPGGGNSNTLPRQKKPGFFSKLFSRRKSKSDLSQASEQNSQAGSKGGSKAATPNASREPSVGRFNLHDPNRSSIRSLQLTSLPSSPAKESASKGAKQSRPVGRSVSSVSGKRPAHMNADVIHIPLKGDSLNSLPQNEGYSDASTVAIENTLDRKTVSALQLADISLNTGNLELVAIADRQSLRNLCEGEFNVQLDPNVDLTEAEHFALYTSIPPQATTSECDEMSEYYAPVDAGEILTPEEFTRRIVAANRKN